MGLKDIVRIIEDLRSVTSTKSKEHILTKEKNNELLKKILWYTYNDNVYGVSKKTLDKMKYDPTDDKSKWNNLYLMLDELASSNINDNLRDNVRKHLNYYDEEIRDLIIRILLKDLKCGISIRQLISVFPD